MHKTSFALAVGAIALAGAGLPAPAQAQTPNPLETARPLPQGPSRWAADYRFLKDPAKRTDPLDAIRYHELGESSWLVLGGDMRFTHRTISNPDFALGPFQDDSFVMQRLQLHADLHLFDDAVRAFLQMQNTSTWGAKLPTLRDGNGTDVAQGFVDLNFGLGDAKATLRAGRQEIQFGQGALFNIGDLRNVRLAFDGIRATVKAQDGKRLDLVALQPIAYEIGAMNNRADENTQIYGAYGTLPLAKGMALDLYGFTRHIETRRFQGFVGEEDRQTFGGRFFGNTEKFKWTWDVVGQTGDHADRDIRAWGIRSHTQYKLDSAHKIAVGIHFDAASGGKPNGSNSHTFDPLYPKNGEYGIAGVTTQSNIIIFGPSLAFSPIPKSHVHAEIMRTWRQNTNDYVYLPGMRPVVGTLGNDERDIGTAYQIGGRWAPSRNFAVDIDLMRFDVGPAVEKAGGKDSSGVEFRLSASF
ncbi:alginate export family protein [Nitrogeniibacter mangrovi]|uniref:Alginate export family protein n=1 Tax=Nitrogeniibacter mangrovi TaxID=2016596 RepID=A0A6C1AY12_9RHOO|nr:alginate export family protein [Nitrogeniibacter mangrovi]QID16236.1 alginate export family protein [Nitrogeniibacter mangrovi]